MDNKDSSMNEGAASAFQYLIAEGPIELSAVLNNLLEKAQQDSSFAMADHYVLYQLGSQQSLIKVDLSQRPFQFWYYDLLGRPATAAVKKTIAQFLWDKCGEAELYLQESV
jgi:hypothetical protein